MALLSRQSILARIFGSGIEAEVADRAISFIAREGRVAMGGESEVVTRTTLRPGQSYTVIARPKPTRAERRLARRSEALTEADRRMSRPSRRQLSAARRLSRTQRRLDRRRPGSRRSRRLAAREDRQGERFDRVMTPTRRHAKVRAALEEVDVALDAERSANFDRARARLGAAQRRSRSRVYRPG